MTVSIVATASYNAVESNTRFRPTRPAALAAVNVASKIRSGRVEAANRARMSTSTVCTKPGLCRRRHNPGHADLRVMPTSRSKSLWLAVIGPLGSA